MESKAKLLHETGKLLESEFGLGNIDIEAVRDVLISKNDMPAQGFDLRIKLKNYPLIFAEIENDPATISENIAKYWKWLENAKGAPENVVLIHIFGPDVSKEEYLSHKETASFIAKMANKKIIYRQLEIKKIDPKTIADAILGEIRKKDF
ncbi:hypothetical protein HY989_04910 [Candidatus Micrarchaeota archaeon]|nr:hypothetical protein [Candidatus Micrarchaeota archaeon]